MKKNINNIINHASINKNNSYLKVKRKLLLERTRILSEYWQIDDVSLLLKIHF